MCFGTKKRKGGRRLVTTRRIVALFGAFLTAFAVVMGRLFLLARNQDFADTAQAQTVTTLPLNYSRGDLYDCKGRNLTAYGVEYYALSIPGHTMRHPLSPRQRPCPCPPRWNCSPFPS